MSMGRAQSVVLIGMQGHVIDVEADVGTSLPAFVLLGLPDASLRESQDRIRSAAANSGLALPRRRLTVNLLPASLPKSGSGVDLAILMSAWAADHRVTGTAHTAFIAELGLDGRLRPVSGVLPCVVAAAAAGIEQVVVSADNAAEASLIPGIDVLAASHVGDVAAAFQHPEADPPAVVSPMGLQRITHSTVAPAASGSVSTSGDLSEVRGQHEARFALEVSAAGGHHMMLMGAPGAGKTMLAERMPSILPPLTDQEAMEVTAIASVSSGAAAVTQLHRQAPYESPHHSATAPAIIGGGSRVPMPGAITRSHRGVLFLDEAPEFQRRVLDSLRQPLETGSVSLQRAAGHVTYPAAFQLLLAANPCPCGMDDARTHDQCSCTSLQRRNYISRLSGPLLDRVDVQVNVERPRSAALALEGGAESSAEVRHRVIEARSRQHHRLKKYGVHVNREIPASALTGPLALPKSATKALDRALDRASLSLRGYFRVLRLAWTLSDLSQHTTPHSDHVDAAMQLRQQR